MMKNILNLKSEDARLFFLKQESYLTLELPEYITFVNILNSIEKIVKNRVLTKEDLNKANKNETVNHILYGNKDGKYAWRKYEIINPLLYVSLVNVICAKDNWAYIQTRFKEFQADKSIECDSIPTLASGKQKQKGTEILNWIEKIEKKSLALSLEYDYLYQTDITDCYGSIYTHSIPWAIHTKEASKKKRDYDDLFGNQIDKHIQAMSFGQTNGIPQGSVLMNFIAEIILGYADLELSKKLKYDLKVKKFHILRFRDDYRIFVNDISDGDKILKCLSEVLLNLGFRLNVNKTCFNEDVISGSIKKDKMYSMFLEHMPASLSRQELIQQLLMVQQIGILYPNSGTLEKRLWKILEIVKDKNFYLQEKVVVSILVDIAYNNPNTVPRVAALISNCIARLDKIKQVEFIHLIQSKICKLPNAGLLEIWIQRMAINYKIKFSFEEKICHIVYGKSENLFDVNWIDNKSIKTLITSNIYIDKRKLVKMNNRIDKKEVQTFISHYS